ncbi:uncharacterized protein G2W53_018291 [Senna tora]|uniref:Uncharacterized protein n=1 Tax=Senna tora TaxID=362788 RepID=A0A834TTD1_9FABA|nr:uncharacterized protein G2W53_018291 [Senna tora]
MPSPSTAPSPLTSTLRFSFLGLSRCQMSSGRSSRGRTTRGGGRSRTPRIDDPPIVVPSPHTVAPSPPTVAPSPPTVVPSPPTIVPSPTAPSPPIAPSPHSSVHSNPQHDNEEAQIDNEQPPHLSDKPWGKDPIDHKTWIYADKKT